MSWVVDHELPLRLGAFVCVFLLLTAWEGVGPGRALHSARKTRWPANLGLAVIGALTLRLLLPTATLGVAATAANQGWGLFHQAELPWAAALILSVLALDLVVYLQHVLFHAVPALWRLHLVHHSDLDLDVTTGIRFHPLEILLSLGIKASAILVLGVPILAVFIFEMLLSSTSLFNHGNVRLAANLERVVRRVLVTPDMHRIHHSVDPSETNSNFGFSLSWWDRLFGTYRREPLKSREEIAVGVEHLEGTGRSHTLWWMLALPFRGTPGRYAFGHARAAAK